MKINLYSIRTYIIIYIILSCYAQLNAQDDPVVNYLNQVKNYAEIYNGRMEEIYNIVLYINFPYYKNSDFTDASIVYKNNYYPNQKVRLDLYKEQLIVLSPEKQNGIILPSQHVEKVFMYNKTFVRMNPSKDAGIKQGYYIHLYEGKKLQLFCKEKFFTQQKTQSRIVVYYFSNNIRYYLFYNNRYYLVKNKGSFSRIFPQYKKQINKFVKDYKLNFDRNKDENLSSLAKYCDELLTSTNIQ